MYRKIIAIALALGISSLVFAGEAVNINTASADELAEALSGVGPAKAEAIVAHREEHGPFKNLDELVAVKGIGMATVDNNRDQIELDD